MARMRRIVGRLLGVFAGVLLLAACDQSNDAPPTQTTQADQSARSKPRTQAPPAANLPIGSGFDFYVLALSWSPSYCESEGEDANQQQCNAQRPYAFVVHGLWPQ